MRNGLSFLLMMYAVGALAQKPIQITEGVSAFNNGSRNALSFVIYNGDQKAVSSAWEKELKSWKGKVKFKTEFFADDCKVKSMGDNTFDVYSKVETLLGEGVRVTTAFDLGGAYLSLAAHPDRYKAAEAMLYNFALAQTREVVKTEVKLAEKVLSDRETELNIMVTTQAKLEKDISDMERSIRDARAAIETLKQNQVTKRSEVDAQKIVVKGLDDKLKAVK
jgi:hypothetical protein